MYPLRWILYLLALGLLAYGLSVPAVVPLGVMVALAVALGLALRDAVLEALRRFEPDPQYPLRWVLFLLVMLAVGVVLPATTQLGFAVVAVVGLGVAGGDGLMYLLVRGEHAEKYPLPWVLFLVVMAVVAALLGLAPTWPAWVVVPLVVVVGEAVRDAVVEVLLPKA